MSDRWSAKQYQDYLRTGRTPDVEPKEREVVEVSGGRHRRKLVRRPDLGLTFDSLTEERRYDALKENPRVVHIDVHPIFQLPHGIRYTADFLIHFRDGYCRVEDVKSRAADTTEFRRLKQIFDTSHPFAPLYVVRWRDGEWTVDGGVQ